MKHKHAVEIIAWANGAQIQYYDITMHRFEDDANPKWREETNFRVKPKPNPDVVVLCGASASARGIFVEPCREDDANLKLTFDGETGELKSAEVLK